MSGGLTARINLKASAIKVTPTGLFFILFRLAFAANERTAGVSRQPLLAREIRDLVRDPCKRRLGVIGKLRLFNKVVDRERARESCTSAGGQGMIRSRKIVSREPRGSFCP